MNQTTRNEILSAMAVYGFLNYEDGKVHLPNRELMDEFAKTIRERENLGYINRLAVEYDRMLSAMLKDDTKTMEEILQFAHDLSLVPQGTVDVGRAIAQGAILHSAAFRETPLLDYDR